MNPWTLTAAACGKGLLQQLWNEQDAPSWQFPAALTELNDQARCKHSVNNNYLSFYQHCNPLQINIVSENPNIYSSEVAFPPPLLFFSLKEGRLATSTQSSESSENFLCAPLNPAVFVIPGTTSPQITPLHQPALPVVLQRHCVRVSHSRSLCFTAFMTLKSPKSVPLWS